MATGKDEAVEKPKTEGMTEQEKLAWLFAKAMANQVVHDPNGKTSRRISSSYSTLTQDTVEEYLKSPSANEKQYVASSSTVLQTSTHKLPLQKLLGYDASNITLDDVNGREYIRSMLHSRGYLLIEGVSDDVSLIKDCKEEFA